MDTYDSQISYTLCESLELEVPGKITMKNSIFLKIEGFLKWKFHRKWYKQVVDYIYVWG